MGTSSKARVGGGSAGGRVVGDGMKGGGSETRRGEGEAGGCGMPTR